eukprot:scaffold89363_cov57-Phaeocystis_antarctica.AAC.2
MAKLHRLRIQGDDLIPALVIRQHFFNKCQAKEKAARREHRAVETIALELVLRVNCAVVRGAVQRRTNSRAVAGVESRVIAGSDRASVAEVLAGRCLQDKHAAVEDAHL